MEDEQQPPTSGENNEPTPEAAPKKKKKVRRKKKKSVSVDAGAQTEITIANPDQPTSGDPTNNAKLSIDSTGSGGSTGSTGSGATVGSAGTPTNETQGDDKKITLLGQTIPDDPIEEPKGSGEEDDPDLYEYDEMGNVLRKKSDPGMVARRQQAELKNRLAAGAETAIRKAASSLAHDQNRAKLQSTSIFIVACLLTIIGAIHVHFLNDPFGPPPTREASIAATNLLPALIFNAVLAIAAFVILYLKFSQLIVAFTWLILLVYLEYTTSINIAKAAVTIHKATFEDIKIYSKDHYMSFRSIPAFVAQFEISGNCCGWGDPAKKSQAWPKLLDTNDLPDSCCINIFHGCGKEAIQRSVPSGYVTQMSPKEYVKFLDKHRGQIDTNLWFDKDNPLSRVLSYFPPKNGFPDELLRLVDEVHDSPMFYYMNEDFEPSTNQTTVFIYKSYGQAENLRLSGIIKEATCDPNRVVIQMRWHTMFILIYSAIQMLICIIMAVVFWYYFVELRADYLGRQATAGEFTLLKMERVCLDDRYNAILREKKRMDRLQNLKESYKKEEEERNRLLDEAQDAIEEEAEAEGEVKEKKVKKAPKIITRHKGKVEPV